MPPVKKPGGWEIRLRFGKGLRDRFLLRVADEVKALDRERRLQRVATLLGASGKSAEAKATLADMASVESDSDFAQAERDVTKLLTALIAAPPTPKGPRTFADVARLWLSGELRRSHPEDVKPKGAGSVSKSRAMLEAVFPVLGHLDVSKITLDDAIAAKNSIPAGITQATRAQYANQIRIVMGFAEYPLRLIERSPIPRKFVPGYGHKRALGFLYPDEDARLMACADVEFADRLLYGFLARNGLRISEALALIWADLDLTKGVLTLDKNKTRTPRAWVMSPDVVRALVSYRGSAGPDDLVFPEVNADGIAIRFRAHLLKAGVDRRELHASTAERRPLRVHDLRGSFVTLALATGAPEAWVMDRTGHTTSAMLAKYRRQSRHAAELELGWFQDLDTALTAGPGGGQVVGQRVKTPVEMAGFTSWIWRSKTDSDPLPEPKTAESSPSTKAETDAGPAGLSGVGQTDPVQEALALALRAAVEAGRLDLVSEVTRELSARRLATAAPIAGVTSLDAARRKRGER